MLVNVLQEIVRAPSTSTRARLKGWNRESAAVMPYDDRPLKIDYDFCPIMDPPEAFEWWEYATDAFSALQMLARGTKRKRDDCGGWKPAIRAMHVWGCLQYEMRR